MSPELTRWYLSGTLPNANLKNVFRPISIIEVRRGPKKSTDLNAAVQSEINARAVASANGRTAGAR